MTIVPDLPIASITTNAGIQVRSGLHFPSVNSYAALMRERPMDPVVVYHEGNGTFLLADGFHRLAAAKQLGRTTINATIYSGTAREAQWFALGVNRAHGRRLSKRDVARAIRVAIEQFPDCSSKQLAEHIGCSQSYVAAVKEQVRGSSNLVLDHVVGKDGKTYPAFQRKATPSAAHPKHDAIVQAVQAGRSSKDIKAEFHVRAEMIADVRRELGVAKISTTRDAIRARRDRVETMAAAGYTTHQIAAATGLSLIGCRALVRKLKIKVLGDDVTRGIRHLDSNRIASRIVQDAENVVAGANLIDFANLDHAQIADWINSLNRSRAALGAFLKRLQQEQQNHGEAA
jgi:hypothetical protein